MRRLYLIASNLLLDKKFSIFEPGVLKNVHIFAFVCHSQFVALIEAICQSAEDCRIAQHEGIDRVEFVAAIELGGLTPSVEAVRQACQNCSIPLVIMIRPRCGGFSYSKPEMELVIKEASYWLEQNEIQIGGIVTGALNDDTSLCSPILRQIAQMNSGRELVCHRCFDLTPNPFDAMEELIDLGFTRILTSGHSTNAETGIPLLKRLHERANGRIEILPGGGIRAANAARILKETGCRQIHLGAFRPVESVSKNVGREIDYGQHQILDVQEIRKLRTELGILRD